MNTLVNANDKHLTIEVPKGIDLSVHTTSADLKADRLEQKNILLSAHSGATFLGSAEAERIDLSSSSGMIRVERISAKTLKCSTSSGSVRIKDLGADTTDIKTSRGSIDLALTTASQVKIRTSSGKSSLRLPEDGAEVAYTASSGKLHTMAAFERKGDLYVFGRGESKISVDSSSGSLEIQE